MANWRLKPFLGIAVLAAVIFLFGGTVLLYRTIEDSSDTNIGFALGGAVCCAVALAIAYFVLKPEES